MADPVIVACPAGQWTKVATAVTRGIAYAFSVAPLQYVWTYRDTGTAAPTDLSDAIPFNGFKVPFSVGANADVYIWCIGSAGAVRFDTLPTLAPGFEVFASDFDATNDYMNRTSDLIGNADGTLGIISFWFKIDGGDGTFRYIYDTTNSLYRVRIDDTNKLHIHLNTISPVVLAVEMFSDNAILAGSGWHHAIAAWEVGSSVTVGELYIDDVVQTSNTFLPSAGLINYTHADHSIGALGGGSIVKYNGCLSEVYINNNNASYYDLDIVANRRKFITAGLKPEGLGSNGFQPTGSSPIIYLPNPFGTFEENEGTGGDFVPFGAFTACADSPSD